MRWMTTAQEDFSSGHCVSGTGSAEKEVSGPVHRSALHLGEGVSRKSSDRKRQDYDENVPLSTLYLLCAEKYASIVSFTEFSFRASIYY